MKNPERLSLLFKKYLEKKCSQQEVNELIALLQQDDADAVLSAPMKTLWDDLRSSKTTYAVDWDKMYNDLIRRQEKTDALINRATSARFPRYYRTAAIVLLLTSGFAYWLGLPDPVPANKKESAVLIKHKPVSAGRKQTLHLPDGSTVVLNASAKLDYPIAFKAERRDVYLEGEGFFDIKHNASSPFYVHIGKIVVKVLGTAFNIKSTGTRQNVEITVTRGKVQVWNNTKRLATLTASQQLAVTDRPGTTSPTIVDTVPVLAWKPAEVFYDDITMEEAARHITERFNIPVVFASGHLKTSTVTATFSEESTLEEILEVICGVSKSAYTIYNDKIVIHDKKNN